MLRWTPETAALWGKTNPPEGTWMPLVQHLEDSANIAGVLWDRWVSSRTQQRLADLLGSPETARSVVRLLAGLHDIGKAAPDFQRKSDSVPGFAFLTHDLKRLGYAFPPPMLPRLDPHGRMGQVAMTEILMAAGYRRPEAISFAGVIGAHHGRPVAGSPNALDTPGLGSGLWQAARQEIWEQMLAFVELEQAGLPHLRLPAWAQVQLNGLVVMADWMASNTDLFPYHRADAIDPLLSATDALDLPTRWVPHGDSDNPDLLFRQQFPHLADAGVRPLQRAIVEAANAMTTPCLFIVEAPMGSGKTEAALMAAAALAKKFGLSGSLFALPTMATSNALFSRIQSWLQSTSKGGHTTLNLVHGKSALNDDFRALQHMTITDVHDDAEGSATSRGQGPEVYVSSWFRGRRQAILAAHVVGTIDQVLFAALRAKHVMLRQLAVAEKVVVIDEVHAADDFMRVYLTTTLKWLAHHGTPVLLLSATLPPEIRRELMDAYASGAGVAVPELTGSPDTYPRLTIVGDGDGSWPVASDGKPVTTCTIVPLADDLDSLTCLLDRELAGGGCAAVICSTVSRAQERYAALKSAGIGEVVLLHSKFVAPHRLSRERDLVSRLGPDGPRPERLIVVGTQVLEQSLDVDFDVMVSDVAPMDLLLQRLGRLHRHPGRQRPALVSTPRCHLIGVQDWAASLPSFSRGIDRVYGKWRLLSTLATFRGVPLTIHLPDDIPRLVATAYDEDRPAPAEWREPWAAALTQLDAKRTKQRTNAMAFAVAPPNDRWQLGAWSEPAATDPDTPAGRSGAAVRDTDESLEVIVLQRRSDGEVRLLDGIGPHSQRVLPRPLGPADMALARAAAACTVSLPMSFTANPKTLDDTIAALEKFDTSAWQSSPWLQGELVLVLDGDGTASVAGRTLRYDQELGLREVSS
ncbi:CRISPR-associated helicase Cas3' [Propionibacteriaceae bacterium G57]|uniref:CRISPR-associated helicase Cas3' n=1 Tax=Aestuariimicrobium sp. G57 TaxID=3418485 RepID=UPI003DA78B03